MDSNDQLRERAQLLQQISDLEEQIGGIDQRSLDLATDYLKTLQQIAELQTA